MIEKIERRTVVIVLSRDCEIDENGCSHFSKFVPDALREYAAAVGRGNDDSRRAYGGATTPVDDQVDLGLRSYETLRTSNGSEMRIVATTKL
jgi:hypothetical protein